MISCGAGFQKNLQIAGFLLHQLLHITINIAPHAVHNLEEEQTGGRKY